MRTWKNCIAEGVVSGWRALRLLRRRRWLDQRRRRHVPGLQRLEERLVFAAADLRPEVSASGLTVAAKETLRLEWVVQNQGASAAAGGWFDQVYLSKDSVLDASDDLLGSRFHPADADLAAGSSRVVQHEILIPEQSLGSHLLFVIDATGLVSESNEQNNVTSRPIVLLRPDLEIEVGPTPPVAVVGAVIDLQWTVINRGQAAAPSGLYDVVYLSSDSQLDETDEEISYEYEIDGQGYSEYFGSPGLAVGASYTARGQSNWLPSRASGDYFLLFHTDGAEIVTEQNEVNNIVARPITLTGPDLTTSEFAASSTILRPGASFEVTWKVTNTGIHSASATWLDGFYFSSDDVRDSRDIFLGSSLHSGGLAAGADYRGSLSITLPASIGVTSGYILAAADGPTFSGSGSLTGSQSETNEGNNFRALQVTVAPTDLVASALTAPASAIAGESILVRWGAQNDSETPARSGTPGSALTADALYLSRDPVWSAEDTFLGRFDTGMTPLPNGGAYETVEMATIPTSVAPGEYHLIVRVNDTRRLGEAIEANNFRSVPLTVQPQVGNVPPRADLTILQGTSPSAALSTSRINVSWTNENRGSSVSTAVPLAILFSVDELPSADDRQLATGTVAAIPAGGSLESSISVRLPDSEGAGFLVVVLDSSDSLTELSETNNWLAKPITLTAPTRENAADLQILAVAAPSVLTHNQPVDVTIEVVNAGSVPTTAERKLSVILDGYGTQEQIPVPVLAAGERRILHHTITPSDYVFDWWFIVDSELGETEYDEQNNTLRLPASLRRANLDVVVSAAQAPNSILVHQPFTVDWTVTNQASTKSADARYDRVYFSTDDQLDNYDLDLSGPDSTMTNGLEPGASVHLHTNHTLSTFLAPHGFLIFVADAYRFYWDRTFPTAQRAVPVTVVAPDLTITAVAPPASITVGESLPLFWTVTNLGAADATQFWRDGVYLSRDEQFDQGDTVLTIGVRSTPEPLGPGKSYTVEYSSYGTPSLPAGQYHLLYHVDTDSSLNQAETSEGNNLFRVRVMVDGPDLVVTQGIGPTEPIIAGQHYPVSFTVTNRGGRPTVASYWVDAVYYSSDEVLDDQDVLVRTINRGSALVSGESYVTAESVFLPASLPVGGGFLLFAADHYAQGNSGFVAEINDQNNVLAVPLTITGPDLRPLELIAPPTMAVGGTYAISWTVENRGSDDAQSKWRDNLYLSVDERYDSTDRQIFTELVDVVPLTPNETYSKTVNAFLPSISAGRYFLLLVADSPGNQGESTETNNLVAAPVVVTAPDLMITALSIPSSVVAGEEFDIAFTVTNRGNAAAPADWLDRISLHNSANTPSSPTVTLASVSAAAESPLAPGVSYSVTRRVTMPVNWSQDVAQVGIHTNLPLVQNEGDTLNNFVNLPISVRRPDLRLVNATAPAAVRLGETIQVSWTVENIGTVAANADWTDGVYLTTSNSVTSLTGNRLKAEPIAAQTPLAPGGAYTVTADITVPITESGGDRFLLFAGDSDGKQGETVEANNRVILPIQVVAPDLLVTTTSVPSRVEGGASVTVSWTVKNQGAISATADWVDRVYLSLDDFVNSSDTILTFEDLTARTPLNPEDSYTVTKTFTLPSQVGNQGYRLLFLVDANSRQGEQSDANNLTVVPLVVGVPDLLVTNLTTPLEAVVGQTVPMEWTVRNNSAYTARADWFDGVYLSLDEQWDRSDVLAHTASAAAKSPLGPQESYTLTADVQIPVVAAGNWYVILKVDHSELQAEENNSNNILAKPVLLHVPELRVSSASGPDEGVAGGEIAVHWTVINESPFVAGANWIDRVYASVDQQLDSGDALLHSESINGQTPLAAGDTYSVTRTVGLTQAAIGARFLLFVVDAENSQGEAVEANNVRAWPLRVLAPDLVVSSISAPLDAESGDSVSVSWTLTNRGTASTTGSWTDRVQLSSVAGVASGPVLGEFSFSGVLAPGESVLRTQTVILPLDLRGAHHFVVVSDAAHALPELDNGNNASVDDRPVRISLSPFPNLIVAEVTPPSGGFSGQPTEIRWIVRNTGDAATNATYWYDRLWLSRDGQLSSEDVYLGAALNPGYLDAGEQYSNSLSVVLPRDAEGDYRILVQADGLNHVYELSRDQDNTSASAPTRIQLTPQPDLRVVAVQAPLEVFSGQPTTLSWTVSNRGLGSTAGEFWYDEIYFSADDRLDAADRFLERLSHQGSLAPEEQYVATTTVTPPLELSGEYRFLIRTDSGNHIYEHLFENNNLGFDDATTVRLTPPPDLEVRLVTAPSNALASHSLVLDYTVANRGATEANGTWTDVVFLSSAATFERASAMRLSSAVYRGELAPGDSYSNQVTVDLPNGLSGTYYLFVVADDSSRLLESDDGNNVRSSSPLVLESRPADLVPALAAVPVTVQAGGALAFQYEVANQGTGDSAVAVWEDRFYLSSDDTLDSRDLLVGRRTRRGLLAAAEHYEVALDVEVPSSLEGNFHLFVVADVGQQVFEANESNNTARAPLTVLRQAPDLQVEVAAIPSEIQAGKSFPVTWTVTNAGNGSGRTSYWYDEIYLSRDGQRSPEDVLVGTWRRTNPLSPGESYPASTTITVPEGLTGSYFVLVEVDARNQVDEADRDANNLDSSPRAVVVSPAPAPTFDVSAGNVTAPEAATSGQAMSVSWTVTNLGDATDASWYDKVYLSLDQTLEPASDIYLGFAPQAGSLGAGASYSRELTVNLPGGLSGLFFVFVAVDGGRQLVEGNETNNVAFAPTPTLLLLRPPADLVAGTIEVPANSLPGQNVTIQYSVSNTGATPVLGTWFDALYLSTDTSWDVGDTYLGRVLQATQLDPGGSYSSQISTSLPGVTPGQYHVLVRADIRNQVREINESNNLRASLDQARVDVPSLALGVVAQGNLSPSESAWYRVEVGAGESLVVTLDSDSTEAATELYVRYGEMPTRGEFDAAYSDPMQPDQRVLVPATSAGVYYILAHASAGGGQYQLRAEVVRFTVFNEHFGKGGSSGRRTLEFQGAKFDRTVVAKLRSAAGIEYQAVEYFRVDETRLFATFDLTTVPVALYDVVLTKVSTGETSTVPGGFEVVVAAALPIRPVLQLPPSVLLPIGGNAPFPFGVVLQNLSYNDATLPFIQVSGSASIRFDPSEFQDLHGTLPADSLGFYGGGLADYPAGLLFPSRAKQIRVYSASDTTPDPVRLSTHAIGVTDARPFPWSSIADNVRPFAISDTLWASAFARLQSRVGYSWGEVVAAAASAANQDPPGAGDRFSLGYLLRFAAATALAEITPSVVGRVDAPSFLVPLGGNSVFAIRTDTGEIFEAVVRNDGSFVLPNLPSGEYRFELERGTITLPATLVVDQPGENVVLHAVPGGGIEGLLSAEGTGVPVSNASIRLERIRAGTSETVAVIRSDASGRYQFHSLPDGDYRLMAEVPGAGRSLPTDVRVAGGRTVTNPLTLKPTIRATIRVVDRLTGGLLQNAVVTFQSESATTVSTGYRVTQGVLQITDLLAGPYRVRIVREGYASQITSHSIGDGDTIRLDLAPLGSLTGSFQGGLAGGAALVAHATHVVDGQLASSPLNARGEFALTGLEAGEYRLNIVDLATTAVLATRSVVVTAGQTTSLPTWTAESAATVIGGVVLSSGAAVGGASVRLSLDDVQVATTQTDAAGNFRFSLFAPGRYSVQVLDVARTFSSHAFTWTAGDSPPTIQVSLRAGTRHVRGVVLDEHDNPLANATLELSTGVGLRESKSAGDGRFQFDGLPDGQYAIRATAPGSRVRVLHIAVAGDSVEEVTLRLSVAPRVSGRVVDSSSLPISPALIELTDAITGDQFSLLTDAGGRFASDFIPVGTYHVAISAAGFLSQEHRSVDSSLLAAGEQIFALEQIDTRLTGRVTDDAGQPLAFATVVATDGAGQVVAVVVTGEDGQFLFRSLPAESLLLSAQASEHGTRAGVPVVVTEGAPVDNVTLVASRLAAALSPVAAEANGEQVTAFAPYYVVSFLDLFVPFSDYIVSLPEMPKPPGDDCGPAQQAAYARIQRLENLMNSYKELIEENRKSTLYSSGIEYTSLALETAKAAGDVAGLAVGLGRLGFILDELVNIGWVKKAEWILDYVSPINTIYTKYLTAKSLITGDPTVNALDEIAKGLADIITILGTMILDPALKARAELQAIYSLLSQADHPPAGNFGPQIVDATRKAKLAKFGAALTTIGTVLNYAFAIRDLFNYSTTVAKNLGDGLNRFEITINQYYKTTEKLIDAIDQYNGLLPCQCEGPDCKDDEGDDDGGDDDGGSGDRGTVPKVRSRDPNDILGPTGFGDERWVSVRDPLAYTIRFENDPLLASAPAQVVRITQRLDSDLDARSFRLGVLRIGELELDLGGRAFYQGRIDLRATRGVYVDVVAGVDLFRNEAFWTLRAIDPATGDLPTNPLVGFLPPNLNGVEGQGSALYSIRAAEGARTGTRVDAQARIVFDANPPIDTPPIFNTLDAGAPATTLPSVSALANSWAGALGVAPLPAVSASADFVVRWSAFDDDGGSGVASFTIFVSTDGGPFVAWLSDTQRTEAVYRGQAGKRYAFYSIARDFAGNLEPTPLTPDAVTRVEGTSDTAPPTSSVVTLAAVSEPVFLVTWRGSDADSGVAFYDIYVSVDQGPYLKWQSRTTASTGTFWGTPGHQYFFYSIATDQAGLAEPAPATFDAKTTVPAVALASLSGRVWQDDDADGFQDEQETSLPNRVLFLDANGNGLADDGELRTTSNANGIYSFERLAPGTYQVGQIVPAGWESTFPGAAAVSVAVAAEFETTGSAMEANVAAVRDENDTIAVASSAVADGARSANQAAFALSRWDDFRADPRFSDLDGGNYAIALLDTGIDADHPFFTEGTIVYQHDFVADDDLAEDASSHGSTVASLMVSRDSKLPGIAPGAKLIVLKVLDANGKGSFANIERALQWLVLHAAEYNLVAVNLSFGVGNETASSSRYGIGDELAALASEGVVLVAASGNAFASQSVPGIAYPAADPHVIAVGAVHAADLGEIHYGNGATDFATAADRVAAFSQRASGLTTVLAPGVRMAGAARDGGTAVFSGTSMAAPLITGLVPLAQQLAVQTIGRRLTPAEYRVLVASAGRLVVDGDDEHDNVINTGETYSRVDVWALAEAIQKLPNLKPATTPLADAPTLEGNPMIGPSLALGAMHQITLAAGQRAGGLNFGSRVANQSPTEIVLHGNSVREFLSGSVIGSLSAIDPDLSDTHVFATSDERFEIVSGILKLKDTRYLERLPGGVVNVTLEVADSGTPSRRLVRTLEIVVQANPTPWQNQANRWDVTGDGSVSPIDALVIFNELNAPKLADRNRLPVARPSAAQTNSYDVNGDQFVTPNDALVVINFINARAAGESEPPFATSLTVALSEAELSGAELDGPLMALAANLSLIRSNSPLLSEAAHSAADRNDREAWLAELATRPLAEVLTDSEDEAAEVDLDQIECERIFAATNGELSPELDAVVDQLAGSFFLSSWRRLLGGRPAS